MYEGLENRREMLIEEKYVLAYNLYQQNMLIIFHVLMKFVWRY
jgi:hypothetical protein